MAVFPAAAAVVSAAIAWRSLRRARISRSPALWLWTLAFVQFCVASASLALGMAAGWGPGLYRTYYLFGAVLNVVWLGLGTVWLLAPQRIAVMATLIVLAGTGYASVACATVPLVPGAGEALAQEAVPAAGRIMPPDVRMLSRIFSIAGTLVVLAGLGWSMVRRPRRAAGLGLLAAGVLVVAAASQMIRAGSVLPFSVGLAAGVTVMYLGFSRTGGGREPKDGRDASV